MITLEELNKNHFPTTEDINNNLAILLERINIIRAAWGKPMTVTSGLRSMEDHKRIYREKGIPDDKIPMKSKHLFGQACDIADPTGELYKWAKANTALFEKAQLWMEEGTSGWLHCQIVAPNSGHRWFLP